MTVRHWARMAAALTLLVVGVLAAAGNTSPATYWAACFALAVLAATADVRPGTMRRRSTTTLATRGNS